MKNLRRVIFLGLVLGMTVGASLGQAPPPNNAQTYTVTAEDCIIAKDGQNGGSGQQCGNCTTSFLSIAKTGTPSYARALSAWDSSATLHRT